MTNKKIESSMNDLPSMYTMKINVFRETREEKNQKILEMLEEGYTYKSIMTILNVSPDTISNAKKQALGYTEDESLNQIVQSSKESQAFRMFQQGASIVNTKIELDIPSSEVVEYHKKFLELQNCDHFITAYNNVSGNIEPFMNLFNLMNSLGMSPAQVGNAVKYGNALPQLQNNHSTLSNEVRSLRTQKQNLDYQVNSLRNQVENDKKNLDYYRNECGLTRNQISALNSEINTKKTFIQNFDNDKGYLRIREAAAKGTKFLMQDNTELLAYTVSATLEALRRYPYSEELFCDLLVTKDKSALFNKQSPISYHKSELFNLAKQVEEEIAQQITNVTMSNIRARNDESQISSQMT